MNRTRTKYTREQLLSAVTSSKNIAQVLRTLKVSHSSTTYRWLYRLLRRWEIDTSHFERAVSHHDFRRLLPSEIFVVNRLEGRRERRQSLKRALLAVGVELKCSECRLDTWRGKPIPLEIDHINGDWLDNRQENLRFICRNCHAQTDTFGQQPTLHYCTCGALKRKKSKQCAACTRNIKRDVSISPDLRHCVSKAKYPNDLELSKRLSQEPATKIAADLGVSSTALKKWCIRRGIQTPSRGSWRKPLLAEELWPSDEDLTKLVWSNPMHQVGSALGVSSSIVKNRCKKRGIPAPPKGYWSSSNKDGIRAAKLGY